MSVQEAFEALCGNVSLDRIVAAAQEKHGK
jgi:hypothetical protein